jgi:abequosyltransferase
VQLSICMATFRRAAFLSETLESITAQLNEEVELVIVDGASPDDTESVVQGFLARCPQLRYFREASNSGVDADYDKAVGYARGRYVWLMTDDDLLKPYAVGRVMQMLQTEPELLFVNAEIRTADFASILQERFVALRQNRFFDAGQLDEAFMTLGFYASFIGGVILQRRLWLRRDRQSYYGTLFVHAGVLFQSPPLQRIGLLADPLIVIRYGNAMWTARGFEIWMFKWPRLIWSFEAFSEAARARVSPREPWRLLRKLVLFRALGGYTAMEYQSFLAPRLQGLARIRAWLVAAAPGPLVNQIASLICLLGHRNRMVVYDLARSPHAGPVSRLVAWWLNVG